MPTTGPFFLRGGVQPSTLSSQKHDVLPSATDTQLFHTPFIPDSRALCSTLLLGISPVIR